MKGFKKVALLALASSIGLSYGCGSRNLGMSLYPTYQPLLNAGQYSMYKKDAKKWTIMVHLGADNNLYDYGLTDMDEMAAGLKSPDINVIILFDGEKTGDSAIYKIKQGGKDVVDDGGAVIPASKEINSGDPQVLAKFMQWTINKFPADHYMLDIWDHGSGIFKQDLRRRVTRSFAYDDQGGHMETKDLGPILSAATQAAGKKIDILGFDACLMGHLELAYQVKDYCDVLVASEETEPGDGWYYKGWFEKLAPGKCSLTPAAVATCLVDSYGASYLPGGGQSGSNVTLSAVNINAAVGGLVPVFNQFAGALQKSLGTNKAVITKVRDNTQSFYNSNCGDIGHFLKLLQKESLPADVLQLAVNTLSVYEQSIIRNYHSAATTKGWGDVANATGMVVYFPKAYNGYNTTYDNPKEILFAQEKAWGSFLKEFVKK